MDYGPGYEGGGYTLFDVNAAGDLFLVSTKSFPVPGFIKEYVSLARALQEAVSTCALQQGPCWVLKKSQLNPRMGQRCGRGACEYSIPKPVAVATKEGLAKILPSGAVLPLWQKVFRVLPEANTIARGAGKRYWEAVRAARYLARQQGKPRVVGRDAPDGTIPLVYVQPGGLVRAYPSPRGNEVGVSKMDSFEVLDYLAQSRGASLMPFNM